MDQHRHLGTEELLLGPRLNIWRTNPTRLVAIPGTAEVAMLMFIAGTRDGAILQFATVSFFYLKAFRMKYSSGIAIRNLQFFGKDDFRAFFQYKMYCS